MITQVWVVYERAGKLPKTLSAIFTNEEEAPKFATSLERKTQFKTEVIDEILCDSAEEA